MTWGTDALELSADNLRARAVEQAGGYSHEVILNWMARHGMTLDAAAQALGLPRRMLAYLPQRRKAYAARGGAGVPGLGGCAAIGGAIQGLKKGDVLQAAVRRGAPHPPHEESQWP